MAVALGGHIWHGIGLGSADYLLGSPAGEGAPASSDDVPPTTRSLWVPPGWRIEQVAAAAEAAGVGNRDRFLELAQSPAAFASYIDDIEGQTLEGYLSPGVYELPANATEETLIGQMLANFEERYDVTLRQRAAYLGLRLGEAVTLASMVEKETVLYSEAPVIAGVFWNRLHQNMPLDSDPTVNYALEGAFQSRGSPNDYWRRELSSRDLGIDSPYNTYRYRGLPPGPIASPSAEAIRAVLFPAPTDYLFFVAKNNDAHVFSRTQEEQQANIERLTADTRRDGPEPTLQSLVEHVMEPVSGHVGVVVKNLATGEAGYLNAGDHFTMASLYKLVVLAAAYDRLNRGLLSFDERLTIDAALATDPLGMQRLLGPNPTVSNALEQMIVVSSNDAGVALFDRLGRESVEEFAHQIGMSDTWLIPDRLISTPRDVASLLEQMATGRLVTTQASTAMMNTLFREEINDRLPKYLPSGTPVAHKTGDLDYSAHDAGIVFTSRGPIVIVVMTEVLDRKEAATESIAILAKFVYQYFEEYAPTALAAGSGSPGCPQSPFHGAAQGRLSGRTVVLDPGHGGGLEKGDYGATFTFPDGFILTEREVNLEVALKLKDLLVAEGATVHMTRCQDVAVPLLARAAFTNAVAPDLFVSIHANGSSDPSIDGTEVYYFSTAGRVAANYFLGSFAVPSLWHELDATLPLANGGVRYADFAVLVFASPPAVLTESIYLTNPAEAAALREGAGRQDGRQDQIARGHLKAILAYFEGAGRLR
jgi:cell division protein YceG involved in septum cleavage/N-acetylmuramoyl-L-alanine amidase